MSCLSLSIKRVSALSCRVRRAERLLVRCALVCTTGTGDKKYLRVSPSEVQWVYPEIAYYDVESNTDWVVE